MQTPHLLTQQPIQRNAPPQYTTRARDPREINRIHVFEDIMDDLGRQRDQCVCHLPLPCLLSKTISSSQKLPQMIIELKSWKSYSEMRCLSVGTKMEIACSRNNDARYHAIPAIRARRKDGEEGFASGGGGSASHWPLSSLPFRHSPFKHVTVNHSRDLNHHSVVLRYLKSSPISSLPT